MSKHCEGYISLISGLEPGRVRLIIDVDMESPGFYSDNGVQSFNPFMHVEVIEK